VDGAGPKSQNGGVRISRSATYAIYGMRHLALTANGSPAALAEVARVAGLPRALLAKIFQQLVRKRLLRSVRGARGGFSLGRGPRDITLLQIIEAVDGPAHPEGCLLTPGPCRLRGHCSVASKLREAEDSMDRVLRQTTLNHLVHPEVRCPKPW